MPPWEGTPRTRVTGRRPDDASPWWRLARGPGALKRAQSAGGGSSGGRGLGRCMASGNRPGHSGRHPRGYGRPAGNPGFGGRSREVTARDGPRTSRKPSAATSTTACRYAAIGHVWFSCGGYDRITSSRRCHTGHHCRGNDGSPLGTQALTSAADGDDQATRLGFDTAPAPFRVCMDDLSPLRRNLDLLRVRRLECFV